MVNYLKVLLLLQDNIGQLTKMFARNMQIVDHVQVLALINTVLNSGGTLIKMDPHIVLVKLVINGVRMCAHKVVQPQVGPSLTPILLELIIIVIYLNFGAPTMPALSEKFLPPLHHHSLPFL